MNGKLSRCNANRMYIIRNQDLAGRGMAWGTSTSAIRPKQTGPDLVCPPPRGDQRRPEETGRELPGGVPPEKGPPANRPIPSLFHPCPDTRPDYDSLRFLGYVPIYASILGRYGPIGWVI